MSWYKLSNSDKLAESLQRSIRELLGSISLSAASRAVRRPCKSCSDKIPKVRLGKIGDFVIYLVQGDMVKTELEMDFVEGANDQAYSSETNPDVKDVVPKGEIWISSEVFPEYVPYILYHELIEANIMKDTGADYASAHDTANDLEKIARKNKVFG